MVQRHRRGASRRLGPHPESSLADKNAEIALSMKRLTIVGCADEIFNGIDVIGDDLDLN